MSEGVRTRRWTRKEYDRLIEIGVFRADEPLELLGGELVVGEPQSSAHHTATGLVEDALRAALGPGWLVRSQGPLALDEESEPEPDIALVPGSRRDYSAKHPARPVLVVEVALSSLQFDREHGAHRQRRGQRNPDLVDVVRQHDQQQRRGGDEAEDGGREIVRDARG